MKRIIVGVFGFMFRVVGYQVVIQYRRGTKPGRYTRVKLS